MRLSLDKKYREGRAKFRLAPRGTSKRSHLNCLNSFAGLVEAEGVVSGLRCGFGVDAFLGRLAAGEDTCSLDLCFLCGAGLCIGRMKGFGAVLADVAARMISLSFASSLCFSVICWINGGGKMKVSCATGECRKAAICDPLAIVTPHRAVSRLCTTTWWSPTMVRRERSATLEAARSIVFSTNESSMERDCLLEMEVETAVRNASMYDRIDKFSLANVSRYARSESFTADFVRESTRESQGGGSCHSRDLTFTKLSTVLYLDMEPLIRVVGGKRPLMEAASDLRHSSARSCNMSARPFEKESTVKGVSASAASPIHARRMSGGRVRSGAPKVKLPRECRATNCNASLNSISSGGM